MSKTGLIEVLETDTPFKVDARKLHAFFGVGRDFSTWISGRIKNYEFVEGKDFMATSPERGTFGGKGPVSTTYLLTLPMAKELSMLERSELGRQARLYFIECERRLLDKMDSGFKLPTTFVEALRDLADRTEEAERLALEVREGRERVIVAREAARQSEEKAAHAGSVVAAEPESLPLSVWLARTSTTHGHGPVVGLKMLRALGVLHREIVKGCRSTKESAVAQRLLNDNILFYSTHDFLKSKRRKEGVVEPVLGSDGQQIKGNSRVIMITPEGMPKMMKWFLNRKETMLRRLVMHESTPFMYRLSGRYSFMAHDSHAWDELTQQERDNGVRLVSNEDGSWKAWCDRVTGKDQIKKVEGEGVTLQAALENLASNYYGENSSNPQELVVHA